MNPDLAATIEVAVIARAHVPPVFLHHVAHRLEWAGLKGKKNGDLLRSAEAGGYEVLLTVDQGMPRQQHSAGRNISIIPIRSRTNQLEDLAPLADAILQAPETIRARPDVRGSANVLRGAPSRRDSRSRLG